ncbi:MAG: methylmalonyl-CoA mutase subunit beta [Xanthobacteraceae bacterium]|nr:methylmalonyl-CoA mutase subunit beta [Xanthobacteraceae bacterium]
MSATTDELTLAAEFPPASYDDWRKLVDGVLKDAPFDRLVGKTADGLRIDPIYPRAQGCAPVIGRALAAPWQVMQRIDHADPTLANKQALEDLAGGASGLTLVFAGSPAARGFGLPPTREALTRALDGVYLEADIALALEISPQGLDIGDHLAALLEARKIAPSTVDVRFGFDPIGGAAARGGFAADWSAKAPRFGAKIAKLKAQGFRRPFACADGRLIHDAGGSEAQELAFVLATGVAYLRALEQAGLSLEQARDVIEARLSADADQFLTMAKFRALRLLWARVEDACGLAPKPLFVTGETAWRMLTRRDSDVNMLRATIATFAAGLGGANAVSVLPHSLAVGLPDAFARRVARNTQLILLEESNLARVADPAAGSGGIETLTRQLCDSAWALFQEIEKAGGAFAALQAGLIQSQVATVREARAGDIARRKAVVTGVSEFPNLREATPAVLAPAAAPMPHAKEAISFEALQPLRLAAPFEALRDRSDAILEKAGKRPQVFLANLGRPSDFTARTTFAKSLFEAGGIEAVDGDGGTDPTALADAFKASGARLACICSSDAVYADHAAAAAKALHDAGCAHIYLAGRPGDRETEFRASGIADFAFAGGNALAMLQAAYANMVTP